MRTNYLQSKKRRVATYSLIDETELESKTIFPNDSGKKDTLEKEIKNDLEKEFYDMFKKSNLTEEDSKIVKKHIQKYIKKEKYFFKDTNDYEMFVDGIINDIFGLGILEHYIKDDTINEIWVLGDRAVWFDRLGKRQRSPICFKNNTVVVSMINKILAPVNRKVDESSPTVDAHLLDGSRVNCTLPPISETPELVIRKFNKNRRTLENYVDDGQITEKMAKFLSNSIKYGANILVVGGTGSGKTSLLNALTCEIPREEHVITIEDSRELKVDAPFWQPWETRNANSEGVGQVTPSQLVKNSLRNSPDRIILGEIRDSVAYDVLQAAMTGHKGTMSTIHADNPKEASERFTTLSSTANVISTEEAKRMFADTFDLIVVVKKLISPITGKVLHLVTQICHIVGYGEKGANLIGIKSEKSENKIYFQDIFALNEKTFALKTTGYVPRKMEAEAKFNGCPYDKTMFSPDEIQLNI